MYPFLAPPLTADLKEAYPRDDKQPTSQNPQGIDLRQWWNTEHRLNNSRALLFASQDIHFGRDIVGGAYPPCFSEKTRGVMR